MIDPSFVVGIDVSKDSLDVAFGLDAPVERFPNVPKGHRQLARLLAKRSDKRIILEATGGYERAVLRHLTDQKLPAIRVNPRQVRNFARATGILAKTDALDAKVLVRFGTAVLPPNRPLPAREQERISDLHRRRTQLVAMRTAEKNRLKQATDPFIKATIEKMIETLESAIKEIESQCQEVIEAHAKLQRKYDVITSIKGVGPVTAAVLIGGMPELGTLSRQAVAALAGLAPFNDDSGGRKGQRHIKGGRADVRTALFMATLTAVQHEPVLMEDFQRFIKAGKPHKVAMTACMRKLLTILNALVRDDVLWGEKKGKNPPANP